MTEGVLIVNKPDGITSHDVVSRVRRRFNMRRVGHAGTLDPLATGVLVVLLGKSTKLSNRFMGFDKAYRSTMILGTSTRTADTEGEVIEKKTFGHITDENILGVLDQFRGDIQQIPPMFSALKHKGKKLYELARQGIEVEREPRPIRISRLEIESIDLPNVKIYVECSKGTYIRQLAADIGDALGCGACISQIERVKVGEFLIEDAVSIEEMNESHIRNWEG